MIDANSFIYGILMCCDESICNISLGNSYSIEKCYLDDFPYKEKITDGKGTLNTAYFGSKLSDSNGDYFFCIKKNCSLQFNGPKIQPGSVLTDQDFACEQEISEHVNAELTYLHEKINLLRLFKEGNVGYYELFFRYTFSFSGIIKETQNKTSLITSRNYISDRKFKLSSEEISDCNKWLIDFSGAPYALMKDIIDEFSWGMEQVDEATGFEQYTTALEMMLLPKNQKGKKQMLANRVSVLLGKSDSEIQSIHQNMLNYYRYRSESLHEGNGSNISTQEFQELENITRTVIRNCLGRCKIAYASNNAVTWDEIKESIGKDLVNRVTSLRTAGVL